MRDQIIGEIQRIAGSRGGKAPGRALFERETGITPSQWLGVHWARWSDAVTEAGLLPNSKQGPSDRECIFQRLAGAFRHYGREPTKAELDLYRKVDPDFPWYSTISGIFGSKREAIAAFATWLQNKPEMSDVASMVPEEAAPPPVTIAAATGPEGHVYLIKSGTFYKIGRSDELERRVREIRVALPEAATLVHSIRTDDPSGI